jgi:hypothetical protein
MGGVCYPFSGGVIENLREIGRVGRESGGVLGLDKNLRFFV